MNGFEFWPIDSVLLALFGGFVAGLVLQAIHPEYETHQAGRRAFLKGWMVAILGTLFYLGQEISVAIHEEPFVNPVMLHVLGIFGLWILFSVAVGVGAYVYVWYKFR